MTLNALVAPERESPMMIDGRTTVIGTSRMAACTTSSASNFDCS